MGAKFDGWSWRARSGAQLVVALLVAVLAAVPGGRAGAAAKTPSGDPPGNNGTVKIDQSDVPDEDKGNEPIGGDDCTIWLKFYGFDKDQRADITFTAHPPSGTKQLIADKGPAPDHPGVLISDDPAGGGQDEDAVISYDLTSVVQGLKPQAKHGYHIKLSVDVRGAPGSAKHKVFWINCTPAPGNSELRRSAGGTSGETGATGGTAGATAAKAASTSVLGETVTNTGSTPAGTALPRTGEDPGALVAIGLWAISAGSLALVAGRGRRRS